MITVIAGTNRKGSISRKVAEKYFVLLKEQTEEECKFLALEDLSEDFIHSMMYEPDEQNADIAAKQDEFFTPADKLVFVVPEYNGSFPGIFKMFIDAISVRNYKANFQGKKVALIGVASGRGGNLRGMDHLTTSLNYLKMNIFPNRLPIALVGNYINKKGEVTDSVLISELKSHAGEFLAF